MIGCGLGTLLITAWYKGVLGNWFEHAPISTLPTSPEQAESAYHLEKGVMMAIQEGHRKVAQRMAAKVQQEVIDSIAPPLPPSPATGAIIAH